MSETARDPRTDPRPGDVLRKVQTRTVTRSEPWRVWYVYEGAVTYSLTLNMWRKWAATAEVLKRGDENA